MGAWQIPVSGTAPPGGGGSLSSLLPNAPAQNPDKPGTSSQSNTEFLANALETTGSKTIGAGVSLLGQPLDYWQKLLQKPTKASLTEQEGPAISSVVGRYSTGKKALASAPRGGGTSATAAELPFQEAGSITGLLQDQLSKTLNVLQPEAASAISSIASTLSGLGLEELGISSQDLQALMQYNLTHRAQNMGALESLGSGIGSIIGGLISPGGLLNKGK